MCVGRVCGHEGDGSGVPAGRGGTARGCRPECVGRGAAVGVSSTRAGGPGCGGPREPAGVWRPGARRSAWDGGSGGPGCAAGVCDRVWRSECDGRSARPGAAVRVWWAEWDGPEPGVRVAGDRCAGLAGREGRPCLPLCRHGRPVSLPGAGGRVAPRVIRPPPGGTPPVGEGRVGRSGRWGTGPRGRCRCRGGRGRRRSGPGPGSPRSAQRPAVGDARRAGAGGGGEEVRDVTGGRDHRPQRADAEGLQPGADVVHPGLVMAPGSPEASMRMLYTHSPTGDSEKRILAMSSGAGM